MSAPVSVSCPAGEVTGISYDDGTDRFHSIAYSEIDDNFADARKRPAGEEIDARVPRPESVALTVLRPGGTTSGADLPVIVYIHGGSFETGSHEDPRSPGAGCADSGAVAVRVGYRTGIAGMARFRGDEPAHHRAIDDCQLALEWVQKNIEDFGGDPTNVTLVGQSAGASIALWLTRRDHYRGAFRRVLACSPAFPRRGWEDRTGLFRTFLGKPLTRDSLRRQPPERLDRAYRRLKRTLFLDLPLGPFPLQPEEMAEVDLVVTCTRDEFYDMPAARVMDKRGNGHLYTRVIARPMGMTGTYRSWLDSTREVAPGKTASRLVGDSMIRRWTQYVADGAPGRVWLAEFTGTPQHPAVHCGELPALFAAEGYDTNFPVHRWLMNFAHTGEVGWPEYSEGRQAMEISLVDGRFTPTVDPLRIARLAFPDPYRD
ncbi:carboxylesterase family protein [Corynebacterium doosanense]|uniref:Carboxylic ester hydrolase n=1 Tax=Corynebacterium doosanense CAU 212 = DSM 45436 TaxID=558173 RepID=A0A097IHI9_9CORY|nr:carboxylesterase family protein [Corynebacterium doosanense]AIT61596.1 carboxylesterase [Corynebacterium doosanense CAU 212 = DSM 45436]